MSVISNLDVRLRAITGPFQKGMASAGGIVQNFASKLKLSGVAVKALKIAGVTSLAAIGAAGVKVAAAWETQETQFRTMLGSAQKAKDMMADLQKFAASTPFQFSDIANSASNLLSFGENADNVMNRIKVLGDVAAGSQSRLSEVVNIVGKAYAQNKVSLETLNQLSERGIPIYKVLQAETGKTAAEIAKMASTGKISFTQLETTLANMTQEGGIFNDAMKAQSETLTGLWSTLKDNVSQALGKLGQTLIKVFDFKGLVQRTTEFVQNVAAKFDEWAPAIEALKATFGAFKDYVVEIYGLIFTAIKDTFSSIFEQFGLFQDNTMSLQEIVITALATLEFYFKNWKDVLALAITQAALSVVGFYEDIKNFFLNGIPTIFVEFHKIQANFFINLAKNIGRAMKEIWDFIKSGGRNKINLTWQPLSDGFDESMQRIADSVKRDKSGLEKALERSVNDQKSILSEGLSETINTRLAALDKVAETEEEKLNDTVKTKIDSDVKATTKIENPGAVLKGSLDAFSAIATARNEQKQNDPQTKLVNKAQEQIDKLDEIFKVLKDNQVPAAGLV